MFFIIHNIFLIIHFYISFMLYYLNIIDIISIETIIVLFSFIVILQANIRYKYLLDMNKKKYYFSYNENNVFDNVI